MLSQVLSSLLFLLQNGLDQTPYFFGYMGVASALVFACEFSLLPHLLSISPPLAWFPSLGSPQDQTEKKKKKTILLFPIIIISFLIPLFLFLCNFF